MGGRGWKAPTEADVRDPICRGCHDAHHAGDFNYKVVGGFYVGTQGEFRSPVTFDNDSPDKRCWEVEKLAADWEQADEDAVGCYKRQCDGAFAVEERIGWMRYWWLEAAKQLSKDHAKPMDWHLVFDRVSSWKTFEIALGGGDTWKDVLAIGVKVRAKVCAHENPQWALDTAVVARLAGDTVASVVKLLKEGARSDGPNLPEMCTCGEGDGCGHVHTRKEG
jgi:hypothetical protein